jgi:Skp family chaperone for outer membrane proteins
LRPYLYFRIFDYDYWNIIKVISRDPNAYSKDKSSEINSINSELWELEKEYESKRKKLEKRLDSAKIYNNIYKNIKDD